MSEDFEIVTVELEKKNREELTMDRNQCRQVVVASIVNGLQNAILRYL